MEEFFHSALNTLPFPPQTNDDPPFVCSFSPNVALYSGTECYCDQYLLSDGRLGTEGNISRYVLGRHSCGRSCLDPSIVESVACTFFVAFIYCSSFRIAMIPTIIYDGYELSSKAKCGFSVK